MRHLLSFSIHHPRIIVGGVFLISVVMACFIPHVRLRLDARSLIPTGHPDLAASDAAASVFGTRDFVVIGVVGSDSVYNVTTLNRIVRLTEAVAHTDGVIASSVRSLSNTPGLFIRNNKLDVRPLLSSDSLSRAGAAERLLTEIKTLGLNDGVLVSADGKASAIFAEIKPEANRIQLLRSLEELKGKETGDGDSIYISGTGPAQAVLGEASAIDLVRLVPLVILVLGLSLTIGFRRPIPALISMIEIGASLIWTVGLMGLSRQSIFVTTLVLPVVLIAVGVSDDVYVLKHYLTERPEMPAEPVRDRLFRVFRFLVWPVGLTTISTVIGLLSMAATSLEPLRIFGVFGALAIVFSTLFTFSLVPALVILLNPISTQGDVRGKSDKTLLSSLLTRFVTIGPRRILVLLALTTVTALFLSTRLRVDDSWIKNLPARSEVVRNDGALNQVLAGTTTLDLMVDTGQQRGFFQSRSLRSLLVLEDRLSAVPSVGACYGIHDDVLRVVAALREITYEACRAALVQGQLELAPGEIEQALMLLTVARREPVAEWVDNLNRRVRITIFIKSANYERIAGVVQTALAPGHRLSTNVDGITPFGDGWISYTSVRLLVQGQIYSIALALGADLVLLTLLLRSLRLSLMSIIPVAFSLLIVFAALALTGTPLGIANSMFAGIAIGIGLDFAIHLTAAYQNELQKGLMSPEAIRRAFVRTGPAILTSAASIALGFSVLTLSEIMPNVQLGLMICLSLTVCACASLVVIPCLILARK